MTKTELIAAIAAMAEAKAVETPATNRLTVVELEVILAQLTALPPPDSSTEGEEEVVIISTEPESEEAQDASGAVGETEPSAPVYRYKLKPGASISQGLPVSAVNRSSRNKRVGGQYVTAQWLTGGEAQLLEIYNNGDGPLLREDAPPVVPRPPRPMPAPEPEPQPEVDPSVALSEIPSYKIRDIGGFSISALAGILLNGKEVFPQYFSGGQATLDELVEAGHVEKFYRPLDPQPE